MKADKALMPGVFTADELAGEYGINRKPEVNFKRLKALLSQQAPHCLSDISNASLMHRVDTKYLLPVSELKKLLELISPFYTVLEINSSRFFTYQTTYYDTPDFKFYLMHHNGKLNRYKVRHRLYVDSGDLYMEVKQKTNKRITQKNRVLLGDNGGWQDQVAQLASRPFKGGRKPLFQSLVCSYVRIAMANERNGERLTLDFNLSFKNPNNGNHEKTNHVLIAEVKRVSRKASSAFIDLMNAGGRKPASFSKYCIGCSMLYPKQIKTNRFKETLMAVERINCQESGASPRQRNYLH